MLFKHILTTLIIITSIISCQTKPSFSSKYNCEKEGDFIFIPAGKFIQGSERKEQDYAYRISAQAIAKKETEITIAERNLRKVGWFDREVDRHTASLPEFCISRNLVTNKEYQTFIRETNYQQPGITREEYQKQGFLVHPYSKVQDFLWQNGQYPPGKDNHPVVLISYKDALAFARWKEKQTGLKYRLPTAEEWEKTARGTAGQYFPWGNQWQNSATNWAGSKLHHTSEIASYPLSKSVYGVEDMSGNVFEFTSTLQSSGTRSVMKGCSWDDLPGFCRAAYQHTRPISSRHILFGFRLVSIDCSQKKAVSY